MQSGLVKALYLQPEKGHDFLSVSSADFICSQGMLGDCHNTQGEKQITLMASETLHWMNAEALQGLCFSKFKANILTEGIDYSLLMDGDFLMLEQVIIQVVKRSKSCHGDCVRNINHLACDLKTGMFYAKIIQSGMIKVGDILQSFA